MSDTNGPNQQEKAAKHRRKPEQESVLTPTFAAARHSANERAQAQPSGSGLLQRQCSCGKHTIAGGMCEECQQKQEAAPPSTFDALNAVAPANIQTDHDPSTGFDFSSIPNQTASTTDGQYIQPDLTVNAPGDQYEQEADRVAETVMRLPASTPPPASATEIDRFLHPTVSRLPAISRIQTDSGGGFQAPAHVENRISQMQGSGQPLPDSERDFFEQRMGYDFSKVRVHTDANAVQTSRDIQAQAFTVGDNIAFNEGAYQPGTNTGRSLLAHELTHVVQQAGAQRWSAGRSKRAARSIWASSRQATGPNIFARKGGSTPDRPAVQRYETSAGWFGNEVTFKSSNLTAALAGGLSVTQDATELTLDSQTYTATGTVEASGSKSRVKAFELGFLQTVYDSRRTYYYQPDPYTPGVLEQIGTAIAPDLFSNRYKVTDTLSQLPVRDGDAGVLPWYGPETVRPFDHAATSTKTSQMDDTPGTFFPWVKTVGGKSQYLVKTGGQDVFRSWLSVQEKGTTGFFGMHRLGYIDWRVDYDTTVAVNKANPATSVVTPGPASGGKVISTNEGPGIKLPFMTDPVANGVTTEVEGRW